MNAKGLFLTTVMACLAITGFGQTWDCGYPNATDVTATLSDGTLTISGTGAMMDYDDIYSESPWSRFSYYYSLITTVNFTGSVTSIGNYAFYSCSNITSITIPKTLTSIGDYAFVSCGKLTDFEIDAENTAFSISNGVLYNKDKTALVCYPPGLTDNLFSIPSTVTKISNSAFNYSRGLSNVFISENVNTIGLGAFEGSNISSAILSKSVKSIDRRAFAYCYLLKNITVFWDDPSDVTLNNGTSVYDQVFYGLTKSYITLHIPSGTKDLYAASDDWKNFNIVEDATLPTIYTITYNTQGGNTVSSKDVFSGDKALLPSDPTWDGHFFSGWYKEAACINPWDFSTDIVTDNITLYAKWIAYCIVTFDTQGGSDVTSAEVLPDSLLVRPANPTKEGYLFRRWYKEADCINAWNFDTDVVTGNITLYAGWKKIGDNSIYYIKTDGTGDGLSWATAAGNILYVNDGATTGDEIWIAAGIYELPAALNTKEGVNIYGGFAGNETSIADRVKSDRDSNGKIEPWEYTNATTLSGQSIYLGKIPDEIATTTQTQFDGFTITGGLVEISGKTTVNNCLICNSSNRGVNNDSDGIISNCKITNNSFTVEITSRISSVCYYGICTPVTYYARGGGVYNSGTMINCVVTNNNCNIQDNYDITSVIQGGGIYNNGGSIINCIVTGNKCTYSSSNMKTSGMNGGGIYNYNGTVANCLVANNSGGGIMNYGNSSTNAFIYCSTIVKNSSYNIYTYNDGTDFVYNSIIDESDMTQFVNSNANDYRLEANSKYIDSGSLDNLPDWLINGTDLAGNPRTHDGKISMGAYEYDPLYTGIEELQHQSSISIFPNPASDFISISGLQNNEKFSIYNINGQQLFSGKATSETQQIAVGHFPAGIYLLKADNGQTLKFLKK